MIRLKDFLPEFVWETYDYVFNQPNSILATTYLAILNGCYFTWLMCGHPFIPDSLQNVYLNYYYTPTIGVALCHLSFYFACNSDPGFISSDNIDCFAHHKYDGVLFIKDKKCRTCQLIKV
jgi:hypothetical protein